MDRIKRRIKGLLNLANGDGAADGEIDNAMRMAAKLMEEHHLEQADIDAAAGRVNDPTPPTMGQSFAPVVGARLSTWESVLAAAVTKLVGTVGCYQTMGEVAEGAFQKPEHKRGLKFYGPEEDAQLAAELFREWALTIGTLAVGKYGGCFRGDGAMYAYGFACALQNKAHAASKARELVITDSTRALVLVGIGSLAKVVEQKRALAKEWLAKDQGVKLASGGGGGGYSAGSHDAKAHGRSDGARAEFSASRRNKLC